MHISEELHGFSITWKRCQDGCNFVSIFPVFVFSTDNIRVLYTEDENISSTADKPYRVIKPSP